MSKTNFDDIDLGGRGIEAGEINSESAAAGQVLTADGAGGATWVTAAASGFVVAYHTNLVIAEDAEASTAWVALGLAALGVPASASAILVQAYVEHTNPGGLAGGVYFRPTGTTWANGLETTPGAVLVGTGKLATGVTVPLSAGGAAEYKVYLASGGTANIYVTLVGYWL